MGRKSKKAGLDVHAELIQPVVQQELTQHCKAALFQQKIKKQGMFDQFKPPWTPKPSSFFLAGLVPKIPMMVSKKRCLGNLHGQNCLLFPTEYDTNQSRDFTISHSKVSSPAKTGPLSL